MPVGGFDSRKVFDALRMRPWRVEALEVLRLRFGSGRSALELSGEDGLLVDGKGSGESFCIIASEGCIVVPEYGRF
jgi:hypothetical protein